MVDKCGGPEDPILGGRNVEKIVAIKCYTGYL